MKMLKTPSIIQKLEDIERQAESESSRHDDLVAEFAHELSYLMVEAQTYLKPKLRRKPSKTFALELMDVARGNVRTMLMEELDNAESSFMEECFHS